MRWRNVVALFTEITPAHSVSAIAKTSGENAPNNRAFCQLIRRRADIGVVFYRNLATDSSAKLKLGTEQADRV